MLHLRNVLVGCALGVSALATLPPLASAGSYTDWECAGPSGAALAARGFEAEQSPKSTAVNTCGVAGGSLSVGLAGDPSWEGGLGAIFRYAAPDDTRITAVKLDRATFGAPLGSSFLTYQITADGLIDGCLPSAGCGGNVQGQVARSGLSSPALAVTAGCGGLPSNTCLTPIRLGVTRAAITLSDDIAPTFANVRGSLFASTAKRGTATVEFEAADRGGGVYRTITYIDGQVFEVQPAAFGMCADVDPANTDPYEFPAKVPCPLTQAGVSVALDTTKLTEGVHTIGLILQDAAGNRTRILGPAKRFTVRNARPNGSPAGRTRYGRVRMWFAATRKTRMTTVAGRRVVTRGRLVGRHGRGIRDAEIEVYHYVKGRRRLLKTGLRSRRAGRLTLILPLNLFGDARGRRRIAFYYRASVPGAVTSRSNLYLTILNRRGGPQRTQPGR